MGIDDMRQCLARYIEQITQPLVELLAVQPEKQRSAGVAGIGNVLATRQFEGQPAFDRTQRQPPALRGGAHLTVVFHQPAHLGGGEIRVEQQAGLRTHRIFLPCARQRGTVFRRPPVLPHDRPCQRLSGCAVPGDHGFPLVGDADGRDPFGPLPNEGARAGQRPLPDFGGVVFYPAWLRIMLRQVALRHIDQFAVGGEQHRPR